MANTKIFFRVNFLYLLSIFIVSSKCQYEVPPPLVEPLYPRGLRVSIPDTPGIKLFAFHGNVNRDFDEAHDIGDMAQDVRSSTNGRWTYTNQAIKLKKGDTIYYWLHVIYEKLAYERLFQSHVVTDFYDQNGEKVEGTPKPTPPKPIPPKPTPTQPTPPEQPTSGWLPPSSPPQNSEKCTNSVTQVNREQNLCKGSLIFDSTFENGITKNWNHIVQFGENELDFTVLDSDINSSYVEAGSLVIKPITLDKKYHNGFTLYETLDLTKQGCTSLNYDYCVSKAFGAITLPPVASARIVTKDTFSFRYGTVEVKARLPRGDWVVPEIWLLPKSSSRYGPRDSGKMVLAKSLGNDDLQINGLNRGNNYLFSGLVVGNKITDYEHTIGFGSFSDDYHFFKMVWEPDQIVFYYDGQAIGTWSSKYEKPFLNGQTDNIAPFNEEFYLVLGVHVGGTDGDFPDGLISNGKQKPWKDNSPKRRKAFYDNSIDWLKTWNDKTALRIAHVKVWAL